MVPDDFGGSIELSVSDFVALHNQVLEYAVPTVTIVGELANFRISKNKWIYFDLKDDTASVRFFGTIYQLQGPLEDGMLLKVQGAPRVHPQFGFSITVQALQPAGEGAIKKAFDLLQVQLTKEGLFDPARKRALPYPPERIGLITSSESAAYADFMKILNARWGSIEVTLVDVQVQGEIAPAQIVNAVAELNAMAEPPEVIVITRGGGSADDLWAFSTEQVTRAVAASRIPTLVAIGHEIDISLAELAADQRASTPSNAAELLVPDKQESQAGLQAARQLLDKGLEHAVRVSTQSVASYSRQLNREVVHVFDRQQQWLQLRQQMLVLVDPAAILRRGYAIVRTSANSVVRSTTEVTAGQTLRIQLSDGNLDSKVQ